MTRLPQPPDDERQHHRAFANLLAGKPSGLASGLTGDPKAFVQWATDHRIAPYAGHIAAGLDDVLGPALRVPLRTAAIKELMQSVPCRQVLEALTSKGVTPIVFKGLGVAHLYYPQPHLRPLGDLDLLFRPKDVPVLIDTCLALGYRHPNADPAVIAFHTDGHYNVPLTHPQYGLFEAHHALYRDCDDAFTQALFDRCVPVNVLGVTVQRPAVADLFILLAVHWGISSIGSGWMWLLDLVLIGRTMSADDWKDLCATSRRHGLQLFVATALGIMDKLWNIRFLDGSIERELKSSLRPVEAVALHRAVGLAGTRTLGPHFLTVARRLSGRPVRGSKRLLGSLICHPGVVCIERGTSSSSEWFWLQRLVHPWWRLTEAARSVYKTVSSK